MGIIQGRNCPRLMCKKKEIWGLFVSIEDFCNKRNNTVLCNATVFEALGMRRLWLTLLGLGVEIRLLINLEYFNKFITLYLQFVFCFYLLFSVPLFGLGSFSVAHKLLFFCCSIFTTKIFLHVVQ